MFGPELLLLLSCISRVRLCGPHRQQPTRLLCPWDSPGKNTGVGCHFLLQCMKMKSESEVAQSRPTLSDPTDCSPPGSPVHRVFQARVLEWGAIDLLHRSLTWPTRGIPMLLHPLYPYLTTRCPQASRKPGKRDVSQDRCRANGLDCINHRSTPTQCGDTAVCWAVGLLQMGCVEKRCLRNPCGRQEGGSSLLPPVPH